MLNEDRGIQREGVMSRPPKTKESLVFPEAGNYKQTADFVKLKNKTNPNSNNS